MSSQRNHHTRHFHVLRHSYVVSTKKSPRIPTKKPRHCVRIQMVSSLSTVSLSPILKEPSSLSYPFQEDLLTFDHKRSLILCLSPYCKYSTLTFPFVRTETPEGRKSQNGRCKQKFRGPRLKVHFILILRTN